jgi:hypothetical protein
VINNITAVFSFRLDSCGIHGLFQKVKESHEGNVLYETDNYGLFAKMLYDLKSPMQATYGKLNVLTGSRSDFLTTYNAPGVAAVAAEAATPVINAVTNYLPSTQVNSGELLGTSIAIDASTQQEHFVSIYCQF